MGSTRNAYVAQVWRGRDPFAGFPRNLYEVDAQGWNEQHPYLREAMSSRPAVVIELGVWKGASSMVMASELQRMGVDGVVFSVDTWLGSAEHWLHEPYFDSLCTDHGFPSLQRKFMNNVAANNLQDYVLPLPLDSLNAAQVFQHYGILADVIHLDAGHDYGSVSSDLRAWWPQLKPGGVLIGDDYHAETHWPGVKRAFDEFFGPMGLLPLEHGGGKCRLTRPR